MNSDERCELCNNFARLKHNFGNGKGFQESHCCVAFVEDHMEVQEVSPNGMCEMFDRKMDDSTVFRGEVIVFDPCLE